MNLKYMNNVIMNFCKHVNFVDLEYNKFLHSLSKVGIVL
jgi:hypothetical protein